jgi:HEAT repeat protein
METTNWIKRFNSPDEEERLLAIDELDNSENDGVDEILIDSLQRDPSQMVRDSVLFVLKRNLSEQSFPNLFEFFYSDEAYLRNAAVAIFSAHGENAIRFLEGSMNAPNKEVKKLILDALFEIGTPEAGKVIGRAIRDQAPNVKITAIEYIGRLGLVSCQEDIVNMFETEDEPMLTLSILMSLQFFSHFNHLHRITRRLCPSGSVKDVDRLYICELLKLIAKFGDKKEILSVLADIHEGILCSHEVAEFLIIAINRFGELIDDQTVNGLLLTFLRESEKDEKKIFNLVHILNKSHDPKILNIIEEFMSASDADVTEFCEEISSVLEDNKEAHGPAF